MGPKKKTTKKKRQNRLQPKRSKLKWENKKNRKFLLHIPLINSLNKQSHKKRSNQKWKRQYQNS